MIKFLHKGRGSANPDKIGMSAEGETVRLPLRERRNGTLVAAANRCGQTLEPTLVVRTETKNMGQILAQKGESVLEQYGRTFLRIKMTHIFRRIPQSNVGSWGIA